MVQPLELHEMNSLEFFNKLRMPDDEFEEWMANLGLLHSAMLCDNCHQPMHDKMHGRNRKWICERQGCRFGPSSKDKPEKGFLSVCFGFFIYTILGHVFSNKKPSRVSFKSIMHLSYLWAHRSCTLEQAEFETKMNRHTIIRWWSRFRRLCADYLTRHPIRLGGVGNEVEIDETFLTSRKAQRGRRVRHIGRWIFGGTERRTNISFMVPVHRRRAVDLLPQIQRFVKPGTTIYIRVYSEGLLG